MTCYLRQTFDDATLLLHGELPDSYNIGITEGKILLTLQPAEDKKMDIAYVRSMKSHGDPSMLPWDKGYQQQSYEERMRHVFASEGEFIAKDVGKH